MTYIVRFIFAFNIFCMAYTLCLSIIYIIQLVISFIKLIHNNKVKVSYDYSLYSDSDDFIPISLIVPAHNEQENIVNNIHELMKIDYPIYELIIVNDGSTDNTHNYIIDAFNMTKIDYSIKVSIPTKEVRAVYYSPNYPKLIYIDKNNGGKSDALNAGINASLYPLYVCLDADSRLERKSIFKLAMEFMKDTSIIVAGGFVRIANGSVIEDGKWKSFRIPNKLVERLQIVEYFRAFLAGRVSWGMTRSMLIVSGAFGMFNKQAVIDCGGYRNNTVGEDMEIVVHLHRYFRKNKKKYKMIFFEDAICWTQGPMTFGDLRSQRRRWQVGLIDSLWTHKSMTLNPRYGIIGMFAIPYNWIFELLGSLVEVIGFLIIPLSYIMGILSLTFFILYLTVAILLGVIISLGGLILAQVSNKGYMSPRQCLSLAKYAFMENFGYRQFTTLCRVEGIFKYRKIKNVWGKIKRKNFNE